jgi:hypothetical protein
MYHHLNIHKLYGRLSELRSLFLLTSFSEGSTEADLILSDTLFKGLICVQWESLQKVWSSERPQPTPTHQYCDTGSSKWQHCALALMAVTPNVYFLSHDHTFDVSKGDVSDMRSWLDGTAALVPWATAVWTLPAVDTRRPCSPRRAPLAGAKRCWEMANVKTRRLQRNLQQ